MSAPRSPIGLSTSRSKGKFEARFRIWGNHQVTDGPVIPSDSEMPPARILWRSDRHGIAVRLNDMQPGASPGGAVVLTAEGPWQGCARVLDLDPTRQGKIAIAAAMMASHSETVLADRDLLDQIGVPENTSLAYAGSMNANAAVSSPHTNTVMTYSTAETPNDTRTSWMLATGTAPAELRTPLDADKLLVVQNALVVPEAASAAFEAALDEIGHPEAIVEIAHEHYLAHLAAIATSATVTTV